MKKIMLIANRDFVLYNFRFELIQKLIEEKYEVLICLPYGKKVDLMTEAGAKFIPLSIERRGKNPFEDLKLIRDLKKIFISEKPDMILLYTTKVDIYGGIVAGKLGIPHLLNVSGLGTAAGKKSILQILMLRLYKVAVKRANCVFFQNKDNLEFFHKHNIKCRKEKLIPGSGVNVDKWKYLEYPDESNGIHFLFAARLIKEKGIEEYLKCAEEIKRSYPNTFFHIAGPCDGDYKSLLDGYEKRGIIIYHGEVDDLSVLFKDIHCLIHPSYYPEGISNVCLEAAASGRPIITTDNPGCRETVEDGVTGFIVPIMESQKLLEMVGKFVNLQWKEKQRLGNAGREIVINHFDRNTVINEYIIEIEGI